MTVEVERKEKVTTSSSTLLLHPFFLIPLFYPCCILPSPHPSPLSLNLPLSSPFPLSSLPSLLPFFFLLSPLTPSTCFLPSPLPLFFPPLFPSSFPPRSSSPLLPLFSLSFLSLFSLSWVHWTRLCVSRCVE